MVIMVIMVVFWTTSVYTLFSPFRPIYTGRKALLYSDLEKITIITIITISGCFYAQNRLVVFPKTTIKNLKTTSGAPPACCFGPLLNGGFGPKGWWFWEKPPACFELSRPN